MRHQLRVTTVVQESSDTFSVYMTGRRLDLLPMRAGEFGVWRFLGSRGWTRANPYSLSAAPDGRSLRITVKSLGDNSGRIRRIRPGARVMFEGPYGRLTSRSRTKRGVALIGAGVGVAPLRSLAEGLHYSPGDAVLLHRFSGEPLFHRELEELGRERGLRVLWLPGRRRSASSWLGDGVGRADDATALRYWVPDIHTRDVYICGPDAWTESVISSCRKAGVDSDQIHVEMFRW
jgi:ferredoxin-NADP reductase